MCQSSDNVVEGNTPVIRIVHQAYMVVAVRGGGRRGKGVRGGGASGGGASGRGGGETCGRELNMCSLYRNTDNTLLFQ